MDDSSEEVELLFLRVEAVDDETDQFVSIEEDEEFEKVRQACAELLELDDNS